MKVTDTTQNAYMNSGNKALKIYFPELDVLIENDRIFGESMQLTERVVKRKSFEIVGCISSLFEIQIKGIQQEIKGKKFEVSITADDTEEIPLFKGIVDSAQKQSNKTYKKIIAYDELYTKGKMDVAAWYNGLSFPIKLKALRDSLFSYIGIVQEDRNLPNDDVTINKEYVPTSLQAIVVIKSICQINGAFGIVNRSGRFEYRIPADLLPQSGAYPGATLFPPFYPGIGSTSGGANSVAELIGYYKKVDYEDFTVKPLERVTIRQTDSDKGVAYGTGNNNYIIQGNMFTLNKSADELAVIAQNIYKSVAGVEFVPFSAENSGCPWIEVGIDGVSYYTYDYEASEALDKDVYTEKVFYVFKRTLSGIQALKDVYSAEGEEYQSEFITDLRAQVETLKQNLTTEVVNQVKNITLTKEEMAERYYTKQEVEALIKKTLEEYWLSVESLPDGHEDTDNWYVVRGETVVE